MMRTIGIAVLCLLLWPAVEARASAPTGIYLLAEEVKLGPPGAEKPHWIKIRGVFMNELDIGRERPEHNARNPKSGWMFFKLNPRKADLCRIEWKDLQAVARQNEAALSKDPRRRDLRVVAFGSADSEYLYVKYAKKNYAVEATVQEAEPRGVPELEYPVDHGMYLLRTTSEPAVKLNRSRKLVQAAK